MAVSVHELLKALPPEKNTWVTIKDDQDVDDIIKEVLSSHERYSSYYDFIEEYFDQGSTKDICNRLYAFCKKNIRYREESKDDQTTALPVGILQRGYGDCKHYATFCGGILDAITRQTGKKIDWCYRFASYDPFKKSPHHVFIAVNPGRDEIWIDPTPSANDLTPFWQIDKKPRTMALRTQIAGITVEDSSLSKYIYGSIGSSEAIVPFKGDNLNFDGTHKYANAFGPNYLGLSDYSDFAGSSFLVNWNSLADQLNAIIAQGPDPSFSVTPDFVKWVFDNNIRSWNFYYHGGVAPGFSAAGMLPAGWPKLVITDDGRLTFDHDVKVDDYRNAEIHLLTAWIQSLINDNSTILFPLKPRDVKLFSQDFTGNPGNPKANLFQEHRGTSIFQDIGKALESAVNLVKTDLMLIIGSIPRNAFLGLVGLNVFDMAHNLDQEITNGKWDHISKTWKTLGGNPDKLLSTINHGKDKKAILGNTIGQEPVSTSTAALLAAAAPIIAAMLAFINKDGKLNSVLQATKAGLNQMFPDQNFDFIDGALTNTKTGQPMQFTVAARDNENLGGGNNDMPGDNSVVNFFKKNPMITAGITGVGSYLVMNKKGKKKNFIVPAVVAVATYFLISKFAPSTPVNKRAALASWVNSASPSDAQAFISAFNQMSDTEISAMYDYIFNYWIPKKQSQMPAALLSAINAISQKYQIMT